jgi:hypothetical protein
MIGEGLAALALGNFVQLDFVILDVGGFKLLSNALLHVARGLPDFESPKQGRRKMSAAARAKISAAASARWAAVKASNRKTLAKA